MEEWDAITRSLEGATPVGFGVPVIAGTGAHTCAPLTAAAQNVLCITEGDPTLPRPGDAYAQYDNVPKRRDRSESHSALVVANRLFPIP